MSISKTVPYLLVFFIFAQSVFADEPIRWSGDKTLYDRKNNKVELIGQAEVHQRSESLYADRVVLEVDTKLLHAYGHVRFLGPQAIIEGDEMHINLQTRTGNIIRGRVSTPQFSLTGEQIHRLSTVRFHTRDSDFTTCVDCPKAWTMHSEEVDLELEGYAHLQRVTVKIKDASSLWLPYMVVPIKSKRQSGFLFPNFGFINGGLTFVQPFFWATSRSTDMTLGLGNYGGRGRRVEWEGRYALRNGSAVSRLFYLQDRSFRDFLDKKSFAPDAKSVNGNRYAFTVNQEHHLPFGIDQKLKIQEVSDSLYPVQILGDMPQAWGEAFLSSSLSFSKSTKNWSAYVEGKRSRNMLFYEKNAAFDADPRTFDPDTVQVLPKVQFLTNDRIFGNGSFGSGFQFGLTRFTRAGNFFDQDTVITPTTNTTYRPGIDPIREATRFNFQPSLYSTFRLWDVISVSPRATYKHYLYDFNGNVNSLSRGYSLLKTDISTQFEKIYYSDSKYTEKWKHLIRPQISYSLIPFIVENQNHPFQQQIQYASSNNVTGFTFDNEDVVPRDASLANSNYFDPQGNAMAYGFSTRLIRKKRKKIADPTKDYSDQGIVNQIVPPIVPNGTFAEDLEKPETNTGDYSNVIDWNTGQSYSFRELRKDPGQQRPLSRLYSLMTSSFGAFTSYIDYYYTPYIPISSSTSRHVYSTGLKYTLAQGTKDNIIFYERSIQLSYTYNRLTSQSQTQFTYGRLVFSLSDYIMPSVAIGYDFINARIQSIRSALVFQSPSQCWRLDLGYQQTVCTQTQTNAKGLCGAFAFNLLLNLTGGGFTNVQQSGATQ